VSDPLQDAADVALRGEAVVLPTDTVYGVGTRPDDAAATARLFALKGRPGNLELPVLVPSAGAARTIVEFDERASALAGRFWPGPLTLVLPRIERSRGWELGGDEETIGVRMPHHPLALAVLALTGPLAVTSANRSGKPTPSTCEGVREVFGDGVAVYLCDATPLAGAASTVVDLAHGEPRFLRVGALAPHEVLAALEGLQGGSGRMSEV
jgi:tRNA threonylcarbamoyl adenosine modification protein (Sua5/YciO/YrdC/YwlC family)